MYRAVKANDSDEIIAIGMDEGQGNTNYHDQGTWLPWTFGKHPEIPSDVQEWAKDNDHQGSLLKVENDMVVVKTLAELQA